MRHLKFILLILLAITIPTTQAKQLINHQEDQLIWPVLRAQMSLPASTEQQRVVRDINWIVKHKSYLNHRLDQSQPYLYYVLQEVHNRNMPAEIALLPMVESAYDPFAYSSVGAAGLWQIMPGTGTGFGLKQDWWYDGRRDIYASTNAALNYLNYLHNYFHGDWLLAIAAYDSGEGTVSQAIKANKRKHKPTDYWHLNLPRETKAYIPRLLAIAAILKHPMRYPITLPEIKNQAYFNKIEIDFQLDLQQAAKLAGISLEELYRLNPGYNRWATDPNGHYDLVLPVANSADFSHKVLQLPKEERVTWQRYKIKSGDSLSVIAVRYKTTVALLKLVNKLHKDNIRSGSILLIPSSTKHLSSARIATKRRNVVNKQHHGPRKVLHTVKSGESLWQLAMHYKVKIASILFWNHLSKREYLQPGKKLTIWQRRR